MSEVRAFLGSLGLDRYAEVFARNEIELADLETLSDADLQGLGIEALGPRRRLLVNVNYFCRSTTTISAGRDGG